MKKKILGIFLISIIVFSGIFVNNSNNSLDVQAVDISELSIIGDGQIDPVFPDQSYTSRQYAQDKRIFTAYENNAEFVIINDGTIKVESATIKVNGQDIDFDSFENEASRVDVTSFVHNGDNTLAVEDIQPSDAEFKIIVPYPTLLNTQDSEVLSDSYIESLEELIENDVNNGFSSAQIVVTQNGQTIYENAFGYSNRYDSQGNEVENPTLATMDTQYDIASLTKMYSTNLALYKLNYEGKLDFYAPVSDYISEYTGGQKDLIRPIDLLNHDAGYGPEVKFFDPDNEEGLYSMDRDTTIDYIINDVPFEYDYNEKSVYSDTDYMLLGIIIEEITGQQLDEYVEKEIYAPLGLTSTYYNPEEHCDELDNFASTELAGNTRNGSVIFPGVRTDVLQGQVHDEKAYYTMGGVSGHAGLFSTAEELSILEQVMLNGGGYGYVELFDQDVVDQAVKPSDGNINYAMGWDRAGNYNSKKWYMSPYASNQAYGHTGWTGTFSVIDPEHNLTITVLTNKKHTPYTDSNGFTGDSYETGKYGSITSLIYESIINEDE